MSKTHTVRQGECLSKIAAKYGFTNWRMIYNHKDNSTLRKKRPNPNILFPGDEVAIPDPDVKTVKVATGKVHFFVINRPRKELRIVFKNARSELFDNEPYVVKFEGGRVKEGRTAGDGMLKELVNMEESSATLVIAGRVLHLLLNHLNPVGDVEHEDMSGIQARLNNLGYTAGPNDGIYGRNTRAAIALFQADQKLEVTGLPDESTLAKLEELHGC